MTVEKDLKIDFVDLQKRKSKRIEVSEEKSRDIYYPLLVKTK